MIGWRAKTQGGAVGTAVAIWRSGRLPKWSALIYLVAGLLLAFAPPLPYVPELAGALLLAVSSVWIGWSLWRAAATPTPAGNPSR